MTNILQNIDATETPKGRQGRTNMVFDKFKTLQILEAVRNGSKLPFSTPVITRFIMETGHLRLVPNARIPGSRGKPGMHLELTTSGKIILNLQAKNIRRKHSAALLIEAVELEEKAKELRESAENLEAKAASLRNESASTLAPPVQEVKTETVLDETPVDPETVVVIDGEEIHENVTEQNQNPSVDVVLPNSEAA